MCSATYGSTEQTVPGGVEHEQNAAFVNWLAGLPPTQAQRLLRMHIASLGPRETELLFTLLSTLIAAAEGASSDDPASAGQSIASPCWDEMSALKRLEVLRALQHSLGQPVLSRTANLQLGGPGAAGGREFAG